MLRRTIHQCYCLMLNCKSNCAYLKSSFRLDLKGNAFSNFSPGGAGEGHGEAVLGATLCGVDWADGGPLVDWGGPPNKSPRRSVVAAAVDGGLDDGRLTSSPSRPRRSTSSVGAGVAEVGAGRSGFWWAALALLCWLERESISSSDGSLSSPRTRPSGPPWDRLGSENDEMGKTEKSIMRKTHQSRTKQWLNLRFRYKGTRVKQRMMVNYAGHCFYSQNSYLCYEVANIHTVCK